MTNPAAPPPIPESHELEHEFFERDPGAPMPRDWVDPELENLPVARGGGQTPLLVLVTLLGLFLALQYRSELLYFFTPNEPVELAAAEELQLDERWAPGGALMLPSNRYVNIEGIPERRSVSDDSVFYKLVGAQIYVETHETGEGPRLLRNLDTMPDPAAESYRQLHIEPGRLIAFENISRRYHMVVSYYSHSYGIEFCGHEPSTDVRAFRNNIRSGIRLMMADELGRDPTEAEVDERMGREARCQRGYLLMSGAAPSDYWWVPVAYGALLVLLGFSIRQIVRSLRASRAAGRR